MSRMTNISCTVEELAVVHIGRFNDPSPSAVVCFDLKKRTGIVLKALWRNMQKREDGKYEMDVLFDNSEDAIPKVGDFVWFLMFPRDIEKVQVQLNNYCNFFVGLRQTMCKFDRTTIVGDALQAVNLRSLNRCHAIGLDRKTGLLVVVVDKEEAAGKEEEGRTQLYDSSEINTESSDAGIEGCSIQLKQGDAQEIVESTMIEEVRLRQEECGAFISRSFSWTPNGAHKVIIVDDSQTVIRTTIPGPVGTLLFNLDWCNYFFQSIEEDVLDMGLVNANGRMMAVNSSCDFVPGDILSAWIVLSPMGCTRRSKHLLRLGKNKVIQKLGWVENADIIDLNMGIDMTNLIMPNCDIVWVYTAFSYIYTLIAALENGIQISEID